MVTSAGDSRALAARIGADVYDLEVVHAVSLTPSMRRVVFGGDALAKLRYEPGQDLMFGIADEDGLEVRRRYTIRSFDAGATTIAVDAAMPGPATDSRPSARVAR